MLTGHVYRSTRSTLTHIARRLVALPSALRCSSTLIATVRSSSALRSSSAYAPFHSYTMSASDATSAAAAGAASAPRRHIEELTFDNLALRTLPVDPKKDNRTRQVPSQSNTHIEAARGLEEHARRAVI